mgnify:CR=1 FL=1
MRFALFRKNFIVTSTALSITSGTGTVSNLIDRKPNIKWTSVGENSDVNTAVVRWTPDSSTNISAIFLQNHNFENLKITYNSGSTFTPDITMASNTASNSFFRFNSQTITHIDVIVTATHIANAEKFLGEMIVTNLKAEIDTNPDYGGYTPTTYKKGVEHELSDGGIVSVFLSKKFRADITLGFIASSTANSLSAIWNEHTDLVFVPFGVDTFTTNWDGQAEHVNWIGDLDMTRLRDNTISGYLGSIMLRQIPD